MIKLINDKAVYRTAPATQDLLKSAEQSLPGTSKEIKEKLFFLCEEKKAKKILCNKSKKHPQNPK